MKRVGHWLEMTEIGYVMKAPDSTKPQQGGTRPLELPILDHSFKIHELLSLMQDYAEKHQGGWLFPPAGRTTYNYHRDNHSAELLGKKMTSNDGRHVETAAAYGNPAERHAKAQARGSSAGAMMGYGGGS